MKRVCKAIVLGLWAIVGVLFLVAWASGAHISTCEITVWENEYSGRGGTGAKFFQDDAHDYIVTAAHVINGAPRAEVKYQGYQPIAADVIQSNREHDVAILRTRRTSIPYFPLKLSASDYWAEGKTSGMVTTQYVAEQRHFVHASISGDSGAPIRDANGHVVGIILGNSLTNDGSKQVTRVTTSDTIYRIVRMPIRNALRVVTGHPPLRPLVPVRTQICYPQYPQQQGYPRGRQPVIQYPQPVPQRPAPYIDAQPPDADITEPPATTAAPGPPGPPGKDGPPGPQGPPGKDAEIDYQRIIAAVVAEIPQLDIDSVTDEVVAKLPPLYFQMADQGGKYGHPIPKRLGETLVINHYRIDVDEVARKVADRLAE